MNIGELKEQIVSLGFESDAVLTDSNYTKVFRDGINRALRRICVEFPLIGRYEVSCSGLGDDIDEIDFSDVSDFDVLLNATIKKKVDGRIQVLPFADFKIVQNTLVYLNQDITGDVTFFYRKRPTLVTLTSADSDIVDIDYKAEPLLALLASYFIWVDDDREKATIWYNEYTDNRDMILATSQQPKTISFIGGF